MTDARNGGSGGNPGNRGRAHSPTHNPVTHPQKKKLLTRSRSQSKTEESGQSSPVEPGSTHEITTSLKSSPAKSSPTPHSRLVNSTGKLETRPLSIPPRQVNSTGKMDAHPPSPTSYSSSDSSSTSSDSFRAKRRSSLSISPQLNSIGSLFRDRDKDKRKLSLTKSSARQSMKQYSADAHLLERPLNHHYLTSIKPKRLISHHAKAKKTYKNMYGALNGYIQIDPNEDPDSDNDTDIQESDNTHDKEIKSKPLELILFKDANNIDCYLPDRNMVLGNGGDGKVFIAYKFPEKEDNKETYHANMISSMVAIKIIINQCIDTDTAIENLILNDQYLHHCPINHVEKKRDCVFMPYVNGPNLLNLLYKRDLITTVKIDEIIGKRYLRPDLRMSLMIESFKSVDYFTAKGRLHIDINPSNIMVTLTKDMTHTTSLIDVESAISTNTKYTGAIGTAGYIPWEITQSGKFRGPYTTNSVFCALGIIYAELNSVHAHQKKIRLMKPKKILGESTDEFTYEEICSMMPDVFINPFLIEYFIKNHIHETWLQLPIQRLYSLISGSFADFLPEDIQLLRENTSDIINEIVYRLYIFPWVARIIVKMTHENPALRPTDNELQDIVKELQALQEKYLELSHDYNEYYSLSDRGRQKFKLDPPTDLYLSRDQLMQVPKNEEVEETDYGLRIQI